MMNSEEALEILGTILEHSAVAITVADNNANLTLFNRAAEKLTGYQREEVMGQPIAIFYESVEELQRLHQLVLTEGKIDDFETTVISKDGRRIPISILITLLHDSRGEVIGTLGISTDLSERRRLEKALLEAKGRVDFYNDLMCHDISNFNQTTLGLLELIASQKVGQLNPEQLQAIQICQRQIKRTRDLIHRVRSLATLDLEGDQNLFAVKLSPVLQGAITAVEETFPDRPIQVHTSTTYPEAQVLACPLLFDLFFNLIMNGVAHNPQPQPMVWVNLQPSADGALARPCWKIVVEDNGPGIPDTRKKTIFQRFTRQEIPSSGIGLSLVQALIRRYGGQVWIEDRVTGHPEQGARVIALLPQV